VIAREIDAEDIGTVTARELPDGVLVGLGESSDHAFELIDKIVGAAACPGIVPCTRRSRVRQGSKRDVFAHISDDDGRGPAEMLRERSGNDDRRLIEHAAAVVDGHRLLPKVTRILLRAGDRPAKAASSADRALHLELDQAVHLDPVLHRQLLDDRLDGPGAGALPLRRVQRQRRVDGDRRACAQPAQMDRTTRTT